MRDLTYFSKGVGELTVNGALGTSAIATVVVSILVLAGLYLFIIWQLRRLLRTFVDGTPFAQTNVRRLRAIAASMLALVLVSAIFNAVIAYILGQQFHADGVQLVARSDMSLSTLFAALVLFILAEIFRLGARLEEERSLTV
jgi:hypothetical protein